MPPRMPNPSLVVPGTLKPLLDLTAAIDQVGIPKQLLDLVRLRIGQINGRAITLPEDAGAVDPRLTSVQIWRTSAVFSDAERAALALAEAVTRLGDHEDPVPDDVWEQAAAQFDECRLGALIMHIGVVNLWNRVNVTTRQDPVPLS